MARKKRHAPHEEHENHERWLVSYADYMTLLFALFVVLYAFAQSEKGKAQVMVDSLMTSLEQVGMISHPAGSPVFDGGIGVTGSNSTVDSAQMDVRPIHLAPSHAPLPEKSPETSSTEMPKPEEQDLKKLQAALKEEIQAGDVEVERLGQQLVIRLKSPVMFAADSEYLQPKFHPLVSKVAKAVEKVPGIITVIGHTDAALPSSDLFRNNWELSALRAVSVADVILADKGIDPERVLVEGAGATQPLSKKKGAVNRRVEIAISQGRPSEVSEPLDAVKS
ncbi:OmpA family protein [Parasalinivibrio latis]|uniref:flagellar motor protein MotB n=1 Tax=Parasalinivibrio latis TaxID=2952610 RepID=UPI0030E3F307